MKKAIIIIGLCILFLIVGVIGCGINKDNFIVLDTQDSNPVGLLHNPQNKSTSGVLGGSSIG